MNDVMKYSKYISPPKKIIFDLCYQFFYFRHPGDNPFYSNIDSMPDIRPRRKSIPLVSELVSITVINTLSNY